MDVKVFSEMFERPEISGGGGSILQTDVFTTTGSPHTWTKNAGAKHLKILLIGGGGGGGGAGPRGASSAESTGYWSYRRGVYIGNATGSNGAAGISPATVDVPSSGGSGGNGSTPQNGFLGGGHRSDNLTPLGMMDQLFPGWNSTTVRGAGGALGNGVAAMPGGNGGTTEGLIGCGGGGGGGTNANFVGANGGNGGLYGGGGGGGGGKIDNGLLTCGTGGNGGDGIAIIVQYG